MRPAGVEIVLITFYQLVSKEELDAQQRATIVGGLKGFFGGLALALPVSYALHRKWPYYRALPPSLKAFGVVLVAWMHRAEAACYSWRAPTLK